MIRKFDNDEVNSTFGGAISFQPVDRKNKDYGKIVLRTEKDKEAWLSYLALGTLNYETLWGQPRVTWLQNWRDAVYKSKGGYFVGPGSKENYETFKNFCIEKNAGVSFLN